MTIKTITTVDGINVVDFGNTINKYYWFKNLGGTAIYVSNKEEFKAGDDGVSELTAKGDVTNIESFDGKVYILGAGKVEIHNTDSKLPPFKSAPVAGSGGGLTNVKWDLSDPYNFCANTKNTTNNNGSGYDFIKVIPNTFGMYQSYSSYNLTHSIIVDFTNVKKVIINGATRANSSKLSATGYCCISGETLSEISDDWIVLNQSVGTDIWNFSAEIDCSQITGENFIYFAIAHGTETNSNSSYLFIYDIEFIYR